MWEHVILLVLFRTIRGVLVVIMQPGCPPPSAEHRKLDEDQTAQVMPRKSRCVPAIGQHFLMVPFSWRLEKGTVTLGLSDENVGITGQNHEKTFRIPRQDRLRPTSCARLPAYSAFAQGVVGRAQRHCEPGSCQNSYSRNMSKLRKMTRRTAQSRT